MVAKGGTMNAVTAKPEQLSKSDSERRTPRVSADRPVKLADDRAELRRVIGFAGGQGSMLSREE